MNQTKYQKVDLNMKKIKNFFKKIFNTQIQKKNY